MNVEPVGGFSVAVLAGGSSRRMGRDKALIEIDGETMVARVLAEAHKSAATVAVVVGREPGLWDGIVSVPDRFPGEGPLGGLLTALETSSTDVVVLIPCDLIHPAAASVDLVATTLIENPSLDVVVPVVNNRRQYVQAAFRRSTAVQLGEQFAGGRRSIHDGIAELAVLELPVEEPDWFADADEPSDLPVSSASLTKTDSRDNVPFGDDT